MDIKEVVFDFGDMIFTEKTVVLELQDKEIAISISPTPFSYKSIITVYIDGEMIVANKIREFNEPFIGKKYLFDGDFVLVPSDYRDRTFSVEELFIRGTLFYISGKEDHEK